MFKFKIDGIDKLKRDFVRLGRVPQTVVTTAAKKGMNIVYKEAKAKAPVDTGQLKKGIILAPERSRTKGKKVYRIVFDRALDDVFQKTNANGEVVGYYPVSQEYGYFTRNGKYIPGYRFIRGSMTTNANQMKRVIIAEALKKLDKEIAKAGLK